MAATPGLLRALQKNRNRTVCLGCGFPLPVYPGRYPEKCPVCGEARDTKPPPVPKPAVEE